MVISARSRGAAVLFLGNVRNLHAGRQVTGIDYSAYEAMADTVGGERAAEARRVSLQIYSRARAHAEARGIILADTKLEFGMCEGRITLADEVLTPDSSRYWPKDQHRVGISPPSFDKQFLRDYRFEFSDTGDNRRPGVIRMLGERVEWVSLDGEWQLGRVASISRLEN